MKLLYFLLISMMSLFYTMSCYLPPTELPSTAGNNNSNDKDDDDDDDDDEDDRRMCWNRDSCQDSCDEIFEKQSSRYECSELTYKEVNTLAEVSDLLEIDVGKNGNMEIGSISSSNLRDIDSDDFDLYLRVGFDSFLEAIESAPTGKAGDIEDLMEWMAENEDIAEVIMEYDSDYELGHQLFIKMVTPKTLKTLKTVGDASYFNVRVSGESGAANNTVKFDNNNDEAEIGSSHLFNIDTDDFEMGDIATFIWGFIANNMDSDTESFLDHANHEDNETAIKWGHNTLVAFCESISSGHVSQCLQTIYCAHRAREEKSDPLENHDHIIKVGDTVSGNFPIDSDGIFKWMDRRDDIFGRTNTEFCESGQLQNEDRMERYFN